MTEGEMIPKKEQILEVIREILIANKIDAKDVIMIAEELKTDSLITICMGMQTKEISK